MAHVASMRRTTLIAAAISFGALTAAGTAQATPGQPPVPAPTTTTTVPVPPAPTTTVPVPTTTVPPVPARGARGAAPGAPVPPMPPRPAPGTVAPLPGGAIPTPITPATSTTPATPAGSAPVTPAPAPTQVAPGDRIDVLQRSLGNGQFDSLQCTMGWTVTSPEGERLGVTAGHCAPPNHPVGVQKYVVGEVVDTEAPIVTANPNKPGYFTPSDPFAPDWATFRITDPSVALRASSPQVAPSGVGLARVGDQVCQDGATKGYQCGTVTKVVDNWILTDIVTAPGDSGGPLIRTSDHAALGIITDAVTLSDEKTGAVTDRRTQYYALPALLAASGGNRLATR